MRFKNSPGEMIKRERAAGFVSARTNSPAGRSSCLPNANNTHVLAAGLLIVLAAGCGGNYPVRGKVTYRDGTPVTKGIVVFEQIDAKPAVTARGDIQADGTYLLGTMKPGDGAPAGKYRVLVTPRLENPDEPEATFDLRFANFGTSGLEFEVKSANNDYPITVTRPVKGR
jgi:hypothetical protein